MERISKMWRSGLAMLLALCLLISACPIAAFATENESAPAELKYVSLGDSMTNGYGLPGYSGEAGVETYGKGSYTKQFADYIGATEHKQLAMSGMRAEDLNWVLQLDYTDAAKMEAMNSMYYNFYAYRQSFPMAYNWGPEYNIDISKMWYTDGEVRAKDNSFGLPGWGFKAGDKKTFEVFLDSGYRYADGAAKILATYFDPTGDGYNYYKSDFDFENDNQYAWYVDNAVAGLAANEEFPEYRENRWANDSGWFDGNEYASCAKLGRYRYLQFATEFYQESIKDADVISLALGNTNFGTYMLGDIRAIIGGDTTTFKSDYDLEKVYDLVDFDEEVEVKVKKVLDDCQELIDAQLVDLAAGDAEKLEALRYVVTYYVLSYIVNYIDVVEYILSVNPDVTIIQVGLMNAYAGEETEEATIGSLADKIYVPMNEFLAALPTVMAVNTMDENFLYDDATFYFAEVPTVDCLADEFGNDFYKNAEGKLVEYNGFLNGTENYTQNKSVIRERIFEYVSNGDLFAMGGDAISKPPFGLHFNPDVTLAEVAAFELMDKSEKEAYAEYNEDKATAIAMYLAFEKAVIEAGKQSVKLSSLSKIGNPVPYFTNVITDLASAIGSMSDNVEKILALPETLSQLLCADEDLMALFCVMARVDIGTGIGGHASVAGNNTIFVAVKDAYEYQYTPAHKLVDDAIELIFKYYDEAYAYGYEYAKANGYIDTAVYAIDEAIKAINAIDLGVAGVTPELEAKLAAELVAAVATLNEIKNVLTSNSAKDVDGLVDAVIALEDDLYTHLENVTAILNQAGADVNNLVILPAIEKVKNYIYNEAIPSAKEAAKVIAQKAYEYLVNAISKAYIQIVEASVEAVEYLPVLDADLYNYFYNNPEEVIAFFAENSYIIVDLYEKYGDKAFGAIVFVLYLYGDDIAEGFINNKDAIFEGILAWADKYGERTAEMIQVYAEATGLCGAVRGEIEVLNAKLETLKAEIEAQVALLEGQLGVELEDLYIQLELNLGNKQAILDKIAQVEAQIEIVKKNIAELQAMLAQVQAQIAILNTKLQALVDALTNLDAALKAILDGGIMEGIASVSVALDVLADAVVDLIGLVSKDTAAQVDALIEQAKVALDKVYHDSLTADYIIDRDSEYVALGDKSANIEAFVKYIADVVAAEKVSYKYNDVTDLTEVDATITALPAIIEANFAEIASADLISIGYSFDHIAEDTLYILLDLVLTGKTEVPTEFDWITLVGEEGAAKVEELLADIYASLVAENLDIAIPGVKGGKTIAEAAITAVEYFAYQAVGYAVTLPKAVYAINEINPETIIMINAISNPIAGASINIMGNKVVFGDYLTDVIDAIYIETASIAMLNENVVFVPATKAETTYTNKTIINISADNYTWDLIDLLDAYKNRAFNIETTEAGALYVANMMFAALNITVEHSALLGDVNGDGIVNLQDALGVLAYYVGEADALVDLYVADVTGDKVVNLQDALCILAWYVGEIDEFPAA